MKKLISVLVSLPLLATLCTYIAFADDSAEKLSSKFVLNKTGILKKELSYMVKMKGKEIGSLIESEEILEGGFTRKTTIIQADLGLCKMNSKTVRVYDKTSEVVPKRIVATSSVLFPLYQYASARKKACMYDRLTAEQKNFVIKDSNDVYYLDGGYFQSNHKKELLNGKIVNSGRKIKIPKNYLSDIPPSYAPKRNESITLQSYSTTKEKFIRSEYKFLEKNLYKGRNVWSGEMMAEKVKGTFKVEYHEDKKEIGDMLYFEVPFDKGSKFEYYLKGI